MTLRAHPTGPAPQAEATHATGPVSGASRRRHRRLALALGLPFVALTVAYAGLGLVGIANRATVTDEFTLAPAQATRLVLSTPSGALTVRVGDGPDIRVTRTSTYGITPPRHTATTGPDAITLESSCPWVNLFNCGIRYDVTLPADVANRAGLTANISTSSGSIGLAGLTGDVTARTSSGSITATDLSGATRLHTSSGSITGSALGPGAVDATSRSGAISLEFTAAPTAVDAKASSGRITIEVPRGSGPYRVDISASSGHTTADVRTDPAAQATITAHSSSGNVTVRERP